MKALLHSTVGVFLVTQMRIKRKHTQIILDSQWKSCCTLEGMCFKYFLLNIPLSYLSSPPKLLIQMSGLFAPLLSSIVCLKLTQILSSINNLQPQPAIPTVLSAWKMFFKTGIKRVYFIKHQISLVSDERRCVFLKYYDN